MKIRKAYKFRLKPNGEQIAQLENYVGACRFLWNKALGINLDRLSSGHALLWYQELDYWSKVWKSSEDFGFLKEVPAHCLQQKLKDLSKAFQDGFDKTQPLKRLPRFKKRGLGDSIRFPEPKQFNIKNRRIKFPKLGWIGFHKSQEIEGDLKNMTITRAADHWFVSIQVEVGLEAGPHASSSCLGIDVGVNQFVSTSGGSSYPSPNAFKQWADRLRKAQRQLSKKQKFSKNWKKSTLRIQRIHKKIANIRNDFLHKLSTQLSKSHAMIVIEDLKIVNMSKSAKGTLEAPGKKVRAKSSLNQSILDQGWGEFKRQLGYKLDWLGGLLVKVNPKYTSQKCSICGCVDKRNRETQADFECVSCGHKANADINAAKNILAAGHAVLACGEIGLPNLTKQEPLGTGDWVPA